MRKKGSALTNIEKLKAERAKLDAVFKADESGQHYARFREKQEPLFDLNWAARDPVGYAALQEECQRIKAQGDAAWEKTHAAFSRLQEIWAELERHRREVEESRMQCDTALERLLTIAKGSTGQSRLVANFILAWWNAGRLGGFDITDLAGVDEGIAADMATIFVWLSKQPMAVYPEEYRSDIEDLIETWRPEVWARTMGAS